MSRGRVTKLKRDNDGNPIRRANNNPILDTREYIVEFDDSDVTKLTANLINKSMYMQHEPNGNHYVILDEIINYRHDNMADMHGGQKTVHADE